MDIKNYIKESLVKLKSLGIDAIDKEDEIAKGILGMPEDILYDMEPEQILGMVLDHIGSAGYDYKNDTYNMSSSKVYSFDVEVYDIDGMYIIFLNFVNKLSDGKLEITDITIDTSNVNDEDGTGTQAVTFKLNGKEYKYDAKMDYDWFDTDIITYFNKILEEQNSEKYLFVTSDGYQNCILFYNTQEWADKFSQSFPELPLEKA